MEGVGFAEEYGASAAFAAAADTAVIDAGGGSEHVVEQMWGDKSRRAEYTAACANETAFKCASSAYADTMGDSAGAVDPAVMEAGGGPAIVLGAMWERMPADAQHPFLATMAPAVDTGDSGFKLFLKEYESCAEDLSVGIVGPAGGVEEIVRGIWRKQPLAVRQYYIQLAPAPKASKSAKKRSGAKAADASASPRPTKSPRKLTVTEQWHEAIFDAITALKEGKKGGSTPVAILKWFKTEKPGMFDNDKECRKKLKSAVDKKLLIKGKGNRHKISDEWKKLRVENKKKAQKAAKAKAAAAARASSGTDRGYW
jgi:hypothetical protein